ncbi:MAG: hypothetical protein ACP5OA_01585 [Candidatus Woesearchaeota archaeon]
MYENSMKRGAIVFCLIISLALIILQNIPNINAFGISTPYLTSETLNVNPGKTYEYSITLQNGESQDYYVDINYSSTENIARLENTTYYVPANTYNTTVTFIIKTLEGVRNGETYFLEYSARPKVNGSSGVTMGIEIKRGITILVTDGTSTISEQTIIETLEEVPESVQETVWKNTWGHVLYVWRYVLLLLSFILTVAIIIRLWKLAKGVSSKIGIDTDNKHEKYTISEAVSLEDVEKILQKMSDEEFSLEEIKNIFKIKLSELTTNATLQNIDGLSRKDLIRTIDKIRK